MSIHETRSNPRPELKTMPDDITGMSASQLSEAIHGRHVRCVEVMQAYLERIHRYNPVYNAIVSMVDDDELMARAGLADRALEKGDDWGWMHGMPHAVKDLASVQGLVTCFGSPVFAGNVATADDAHVARIRSAGAIFIGKTNTPEFGLGSQTYNSVYGTTGNAFDPNLTAGGSSGGAAVGMALQMLPIADGSDMMGSLRNPAGYNNVIGFRPSQGRVPGVPAVPGIDIYYQQLLTDGPMGRNVEDTIRLLVTMAGYDSRSPLSLRDDMPGFDRFRKTDLKGFRIGWMGDYEGYLATEPGVLDLCQQALKKISNCGAVIQPCQPAYDMARLWETWLTLRHWIVGNQKPLYDDPEKKKLLKPELVWEIEGSFDMPASRVSAAAIARTDWYRALHTLFERYDLLALPTAQTFPFPADIHWPDAVDGRAMDTYHRWMEVVVGGTLAGLPIVNLPAGFDDQGRPMGMQFMGPMGHDRQVLEFAMAYEAATDYLDKRPLPREAI
jgi:amidase